MLADETECITLESMADGLHIYENPVGVLTNNPPFPQQLFALNNYRKMCIRDSFIMVLGGMGFMIGTGGTALVAKVLGEGEKKEANRYFSMMVLVLSLIHI